MPSFNNKRKCNRKIKKLKKANLQLQHSANKLIDQDYHENWPVRDLASNQIDGLTNQLGFRVMVWGTAGSMLPMIGLRYLEKAIMSLDLQDQSLKNNLLIMLMLAAYIGGGYALTKMSYHRNGFWNPFTLHNQVHALRHQYKENCVAIEKLTKKGKKV